MSESEKRIMKDLDPEQDARARRNDPGLVGATGIMGLQGFQGPEGAQGPMGLQSAMGPRNWTPKEKIVPVLYAENRPTPTTTTTGPILCFRIDLNKITNEKSWVQAVISLGEFFRSQ